MSYYVGVDIGGTRTVAAVCRRDRGPVIAADLPSVVFASADGALLVGEQARRRAPDDPGRVARQFTGRVGDGTPLLVGDVAVPAEALVTRLIARAVEQAGAQERRAAVRTAVAHPASWGEYRVMALRSALSANDFGGVLLLSDAQAAALAQDARERLAPGAVVAVHDLGGAGSRATVLRKLDDRFAQLGQTEEVEVGGVDFDEAVLDHVRSALGPKWTELDPADPAVLAAVARLREECVRAKETLSADTDVLIPVVLPGIETEVRLARVEFEDLVRPAVEATAAALERALGAAGFAPGEPVTVVLTGGSALIPLVTQVVSERLGWPVSVGPDPRGMVAAGAALAARGADAGPTRIVPRPAVPAPRPADPVPGSRPGAPSTVERRRLLGRLATASAIAVAVGAVAIAAVSVTMWMTMNRVRPAGADIDAVTGNPATTTEVVLPTTAAPPAREQRQQQPATSATSRRPRTTMPSGPRPTTGMPTTTTPPKATMSTVPTTPATTTMPPMSTAATTTAGQP